MNTISAYDKLLHSELFQVYRSAFEQVTGQSLSLLPPNLDDAPEDEFKRCRNNFCDFVINTAEGCNKCKAHCSSLAKNATNRAYTSTCFAGLRETMVPVKAHNQVVAYLKTGQVRTTDQPLSDSYRKTIETIVGEKVTTDLEKTYNDTINKTTSNYRAQLALIGAFALQLSQQASAFDSDQAATSDNIVERCKKHIIENLNKKIVLQDLAEFVDVSPSYLCKVFKADTGMTILEYVNKKRILWAKRLLANKETRVIEIAYEIGFQSLSQFNRSFHKYAGESPTQYRKHLKPDAIALAG